MIVHSRRVPRATAAAVGVVALGVTFSGTAFAADSHGDHGNSGDDNDGYVDSGYVTDDDGGYLGGDDFASKEGYVGEPGDPSSGFDTDYLDFVKPSHSTSTSVPVKRNRHGDHGISDPDDGGYGLHDDDYGPYGYHRFWSTEGYGPNVCDVRDDRPFSFTAPNCGFDNGQHTFRDNATD